MIVFVVCTVCLVATQDVQLGFNILLWTHEHDRILYMWHKMADN